MFRRGRKRKAEERDEEQKAPPPRTFTQVRGQKWLEQQTKRLVDVYFHFPEEEIY